jgi:hypothetical protein
MKTLAKFLGITALGLISQNLVAQEKYFLKGNYDKYAIDTIAVDIDSDKVADAIIIDYDFNLDGKRDAYALYKIAEKDEKSYYIHTMASMVVFDKDGDGKDDELFLDTDNDGILDEHRVVPKRNMI